jgi:WD40 repeat protein
MGYVPGGRLLVVGGDDGFLALVDPLGGRIVKRLPGHVGRVVTPSFSADGRLMATTSLGAGSDIILWALPSGKPIARPLRSSPEPVGDVSLSPDGGTLAIERERNVEIVDVTTLRHRAWLPDSKTVIAMRFTPDGRYIVGGSYKGWARLWSTKTWQPATRALAGHAGGVLLGLSTSPHGRTLATGSTDGTIRLYDLPTQQPLGAPLPGVPNAQSSPNSPPTAPTYSPSPMPDAPTAGTYGRHRGRAARAPSPAARSPQPSGRPRYPGATTRPPAPSKRERARRDAACGGPPTRRAQREAHSHSTQRAARNDARRSAALSPLTCSERVRSWAARARKGRI